MDSLVLKKIKNSIWQESTQIIIRATACMLTKEAYTIHKKLQIRDSDNIIVNNGLSSVLQYQLMKRGLHAMKVCISQKNYSIQKYLSSEDIHLIGKFS